MADESVDWDSHLAALPSPADGAGATPAAGTVDWDSQLANLPAPGSDTVQTSADSTPVRYAKVAGNAIAGGVNNILAIPHSLDNLLSKNPEIAPDAEKISSLTGLGQSNKDLQPKTAGERYTAAAAGALPDAAVAVLTGGSALPALAMTESGALASQAINEAMPGNKAASVVAGIIGSVGAAGAAGWLQSSKKAKAAVELLSNREQILDAAKSALAATVNDAAEARDVGVTKLAELKSASGARLDSVKNFVSDMVDHVTATAKGTTDWVADKLGQSTTAEQVGRAGQTEMRNWVDKVLPAQEATLIKPVNDVMMTESLPATGLKAVADTLPKSKLASLKSNLPPDLLDSFNDAVELGKPITWNDARRIRTEIGAMGKSNKVVNDIGDSRLDALYSAATQDLGAAATAKGAGDQFANYNTEMTKLYNFRDNVANKFITTSNVNAESQLPGQAAKGFLTRAKTEGTEIAAMRANTPKVADELGSYAIKNDQWGDLSPEAKAGLVLDPSQHQALETATAAAAQAKTNGASIVGQAKSEHDALVTAAQSEQLKQMLAARATKREAQATIDAAERVRAEAAAAVPEKPNPITNLVHQVRSGIAGVIGSEALNALAPSMPPGARAAMLAAGYLIPATYRAGKKLLSNPQNLLAPAVGATVGAQTSQMNQSATKPAP